MILTEENRKRVRFVILKTMLRKVMDLRERANAATLLDEADAELVSAMEKLSDGLNLCAEELQVALWSERAPKRNAEADAMMLERFESLLF